MQSSRFPVACTVAVVLVALLVSLACPVHAGSPSTRPQGGGQGATARPGARPTDPRLLPSALRLSLASVTAVRNQLPTLCGAQVVVRVKNVSTRPVTLYLDLCGICFWLVSVDGSPFQPAWKAVHRAPCRHRTLVTLAPGASRQVDLALDLQGQGTAIRIGYQPGDLGSPLPLLVTESVALP